MSSTPIEVRIRPSTNKELAQVVVRIDDYDKDAWLMSFSLPYVEAVLLAHHMRQAEWFYEENTDGPFCWEEGDVPPPSIKQGEEGSSPPC